MLATAIVTEVDPPCTADESCFLVEELAIHTIAISYNRAFPLPQWPIPTPIRKNDVSTIICDHLLGRISHNAAVEQGQESHLLDALDELGSVVDVGGGHKLELEVDERLHIRRLDLNNDKNKDDDEECLDHKRATGDEFLGLI